MRVCGDFRFDGINTPIIYFRTNKKQQQHAKNNGKFNCTCATGAMSIRVNAIYLHKY